MGSNCGTIVSVRDELISGDDELAEWMRSRQNASWILDTSDSATQTNFAKIANELNGSAYKPTGVAEFLSGADPWLIAKSEEIGATIVTHERLDLDCKRRVPLVNLCPPRNINCIDTFDFMRKHKAKFT